MKQAHPKSDKLKKPHARVHAESGGRLTRLLAFSILVAAGFALFLPVVVNQSFYYPFMFLKSILFRGAVQVMLLLYVILAAKEPAYRPRLNLISYAVLVWFGVLVLSSLPGISIDAWSSWWGDFRRMGGLIMQLHLLAYFFVLSQTLKRERDWLILFTTSLFAGVLMGFSGMVEYLNLKYLYQFPNESRVEGAAGNANFFATVMLLDFFLALWLLVRKEKSATYALMARTWLVLLALLDLFAIGWDLFMQADITSGLALPSVAVFALLLHAVSLGWFTMCRNVRAGQIFIGLCGAWCLFWMYQTQTRGALVGFAGSLLLLSGIYLWVGPSRRWRLVCGGMILFVILAPAVVLINRGSTWVRNHPTLLRYTMLSSQDATAEVRLMAWKASTHAILDRPLLGWGPENFKNAFDLHFPGEIYHSLLGEVWEDRAHNLVMDVGVTTGMVGLALYLGLHGLIIVFLWRHWVRTKDFADSLMLAALLVAYFVQGLFTFDTINSDVIRLLILAYIAYLYGETGNRTGIARPHIPARSAISWRGWVSVGAAAAIMPIAWSYAVSQPFSSNRLVRQAHVAEHVLDSQTRTPRLVFNDALMRLFEEADSYRITGWNDLHELAANYAFEVAQTPYIPAGQKVRAVRMGVDFLEESIRNQPANARNYLYQASLVNGTSDLVAKTDPGLAKSLAENVLVRLEQAETLSPTRPQVHFEKSKALLFLGRNDERIQEFAKGVALCPAIKEPHLDLVTLYIAAGRDEAAAAEWKNIKARGFPLTAADYDRVLAAYGAGKKFAPMVELYKEQLTRTQGDADILAHLASIYREMGEIELARQTAMQAASLSPKIAGELQSFLDTLKSQRGKIN
jgi:O-antigen ligase/Flp pilus assembly protein TadD